MLTRDLTLDIAGLTLGLRLPSAAWLPPLAERYAAFLSAAPAAWQVELAHDPDLAGTDRPWVRHDGPVTTFRVLSYAGEIDLATRRAHVAAPDGEHAASAIERTLAYICMQALPRDGTGLLLHGAGIVIEGGGYVFAGHSGAGKSTVARLAEGYGQVLTDENVVLRLGPPGAELHSTPFWGFSTPPALARRTRQQAPVRAICLLAHDPGFTLQRLSQGEAVAALLTTEKVATERVESAQAWLSVAAGLVARVPVYRLGFRPVAQLWQFLHTHLPPLAASQAAAGGPA